MSAYSAARTNDEFMVPTDAPRMIARWERLGRPAIELEPGVIVSNLERWLYNNPTATGSTLGRIREYLYVDTFGISAKAA
jgi:hypothetical protein